MGVMKDGDTILWLEAYILNVVISSLVLDGTLPPHRGIPIPSYSIPSGKSRVHTSPVTNASLFRAEFARA